MNTFSVDKATTIRQPSTANLMIDSADRNLDVYPSPYNFQINKSQNTQQGFFTRIGVCEVVLNWAEGNLFGSTISLDISGTSVRSTVPINFNGFGDVAFVLDAIADLSGTNGVGLRVAQVGPYWGIVATNGRFRVLPSGLATALRIQTLPLPASQALITFQPDLRSYEFIDITSSSLTYAQDTKDTSTAAIEKDVLCRWYFSEDVPENQDKYGFPILQGYEPFSRRRIYNPPKQIKWDNNLPLGNLLFQIYNEDGDIVEETFPYNPNTPDEPMTRWFMTLQLSEN